MNTCISLDLSRSNAEADRRSAFVVTRSYAGIDLPGAPRTMSDDEALAAHGPPAGARAPRAAARENSRTCSPGDFPALTEFSKHCYVKSHEDIPRFIQEFFTALGLQYRWVVTRDAIGSKILFTVVFKLSGPSFQTHTQFLTILAPPSRYAHKRYGNTLFTSLNVTRQSFSCMQQEFTIDDVFKAVIMATLKSSDTHALPDANDQLLDDLNDNMDLTFAHIQTVCARQFRRRKDKDRFALSSPTVFGTPRGPPHTSPSKPEKYNKYKHQGANPYVTMLCNTLEEHGVRPEKVLRKAGLAGAEWNAPATVTALFAAAHPYFTESVPCDSDKDQDDDSASDYDS